MPPADTGRFEYWAGVDTPAVGGSALREFDRFYSTVHVPEVLAYYPGMLSCARYRLTEQDERGDRGPMWLARYTMDEHAAARYRTVNSDPGFVMPFTPMPLSERDFDVRWRFLWRSLASYGDDAGTSRGVRLIGMDPAPGTRAEELTAFNAFYDRTHLREARGALRSRFVTRYELCQAFSSSAAPRYAAVYELDSPAVTNLPVPRVTDGPPSWRDRNTHWRLTYALIERIDRG
ncbi:hypothetical protein ACFPN7_11805 [Amycolatopsis halotolerans]|uniref:hypothetical protein n=1 Tax=Amycolatopsis halotolerans TaxID=330083 RepID=UPI00361BFA88